jgi:uncharacterized protein (DUF1015 family)
MTRDRAPSLYVYSQRYRHGGRTIERVGFIALMEIESKKGRKVLPHENTLAAPKIDRLELTRAVRANMSPIYVLYDDPRGSVSGILRRCCLRTRPFMDVRFEGARSRAWRIDDPKAIQKIERLMSAKDVFIADGHHRYEVSRMYSKESGSGASGYIMVYFVAADEKMLTVLPAHRLPRDMGRLTAPVILEKLAEYFTVKRSGGLNAALSAMARLSALGAHAFGLCLGRDKFYVLVLKDVRSSDAAIKDKPRDWKRLDVSILHRFIFQHVLGISDSDENIEFVKSPEEAALLVDGKKFKSAFFLNPTRVSEIKRIARLGERMPRKATYFYPKPVSGVVINPLY